MRTFLVFALCVAAVAAGPAKNLPSTWKTCKQSDPDFTDCLSNAVPAAISELAEKGSKTFGIHPIEPLMISNIMIDQSSGNVPIKLNFTNLKLAGLKNLKATEIKADIDNNHIAASVLFDSDLVIDSDYEISGKVLILPITGNGKCQLVLQKPVTAQVDIMGKRVTKDGEEYMVAEDFKFVFQTSRLKIHFENLFNGNKQLGDQMNIFLNENWSEILNELRGSVQEAFGYAFKDITNRIFNKVPVNKMFPK